MGRNLLAASTACYLKQGNRILLIKFSKKWGQVYAPPGGKVIFGETPTECMIREYQEETGLILKNPKLKGISYWNWCDKESGIIYIYSADSYEGLLTSESSEGILEWIDIENLPSIKQFDMNQKFQDYLWKEEIFEGKFLLNEDNTVKEYSISKI